MQISVSLGERLLVFPCIYFNELNCDNEMFIITWLCLGYNNTIKYLLLLLQLHTYNIFSCKNTALDTSITNTNETES